MQEMKLLLVIFFFAFQFSWGQEKGIVYYGHIESPGMKSPAGPDLNSYLVFNRKESYYVSAKDSLEKENKGQKIFTREDGETKVVNNGKNTFRFGKQVYYNRAKDSMWWNQRFKGNIYVAESTPKINWKLSNETKQIGKFTAHKAVGDFRGRTYTAWYILEVPLPYGPWKLQGAPGLIIEAYDEKKEMYLYFKSIEYPTKSKAVISQVLSPKGSNPEWLTIKEFENLLRKSLEKAYNNTVIMSEKYGGDRPIEPKFSEVYIESF